jgi:hypothetical protein
VEYKYNGLMDKASGEKLQDLSDLLHQLLNLLLNIIKYIGDEKGKVDVGYIGAKP